MPQETAEQYFISDAAKKVEVEAHVLRYWEEELKLPIQRNHLGHRFYTEEDIERFCMIRRWKEEGLQLKAIRNALNNSKTIVLPGAEVANLAEKQVIHTEAASTVSHTQPEAASTVSHTQPEGASTVSHTQPESASAGSQVQQRAAVRRVRSTLKGKGRKAKKNRQKLSLLKQNKERELQENDKNENLRGTVAEAGFCETPSGELAPSGEALGETISNETLSNEKHHALEVVEEDEKSRKAARFQFLLSQMMKEAVRSNNEELLSNVQEMVVKEMDYQFRQQEEREQEREERRLKREEEHFKKIDSMLRNRREQAAERQKRKTVFGLHMNP